MANLDPKIIEGAKQAAARLELPARLIAAWWVAENGWDFPQDNNVGNVSYQGEGLPTGGVFKGVISVNANRACVYDSETDGVNAFVLLLETPKSEKALSIDLSDLRACGSDVKKMTEVIGDSNWASSHYDDGNGHGSLIWDVFNSPGMVSAFPDSAPAAVKVESPAPVVGIHTYIIQEGDTLSGIALKYRVPVGVLQRLNGIEDANKIEAGAALKLPQVYIVVPGDTVSVLSEGWGETVDEVARVNQINPNVIDVGQRLYY